MTLVALARLMATSRELISVFPQHSLQMGTIVVLSGMCGECHDPQMLQRCFPDAIICLDLVVVIRDPDCRDLVRLPSLENTDQ